MEPNNFTSLLQNLTGALQRWADWLPGDRDATKELVNAKYEFHEIVDDERLSVLAWLGANRHGYLGELVDKALKRVLRAGQKFAAACDGLTPSGKEFWQDIAHDDIPVSDSAYPDEFGVAVAWLQEALYRCDILFGAVDQAIRQADSPDGDGGTGYIRRFNSEGYFPRELRKELKISDGSLNTYAKDAGVVTPGRGKGRSHRYSLTDVAAICRYIIEQIHIEQVATRAKQLLLKIETKSKTES